MPEIGTSGLMSGERKRDVAARPKSPRLSSTLLAPSALLAPSYLPNSRSTSQPSSPAAASGRADGLGGGADARGGGRYPPPDGGGASGAGWFGAALTCDA